MSRVGNNINNSFKMVQASNDIGPFPWRIRFASEMLLIFFTS